MATFGQLREAVLSKARVCDQFQFRRLGPEHDSFWDEMNDSEYRKGYSPDYLRSGSPALCEMDLLTNDEFREWIEKCPGPETR